MVFIAYLYICKSAIVAIVLAGVKQTDMKKFTVLLALTALTLGGVDTFAQVGRKAGSEFQRAQARKISSYAGKKGFSQAGQYWSVGGGIGYANYFGDLAPSTNPGSTSFNDATPYFGAFLGKRVSPFITLKLNLAWMRIAGDDNLVDPTSSTASQSRYIRNLSFQNNILEGSFLLQGDLFPTPMGAIRREVLNPYGFIGLSLFTNNPEALGPWGTDYQDKWIGLRELRTEGQTTAYPLINIGVPIGVGVRYRLTNDIDIALEFGYRLTFTNFLDDVGTTFPSASALRTMTPLARSMSNRSAEAFSATGKQRSINGRTFASMDERLVRQPQSQGQTVLDADGNALLGADGNVFKVYRGYEGGGSPRGGAGRDYVLVTGLHLTYIIPQQTSGTKRRIR